MAKANKLKIGLVLDTSLDQPDGVQQYVITIGEWLRGRGHEVHYLVGESKRTDLTNVQSLARNVGVRFNGNSTTIPLPTSKKKLRDFLEQQQFDVLHVQMPHSPFMAQRLILAASDKTAIVGTFHIAPYSRLVSIGNRALGVWLRPSLKRFDTIVSVSSAAASFAQSSFGIKTKVLPNVIEYQRFKTAQPYPQYDDGRITILFLGRLVPRKGCEVLLEAVRQLSEHAGLPPFRVLVCGSGPQESKLKKFVAKNKLRDIVSFMGFVDETEKISYYASADISVFPSSGGESFGIVLLEAMASGKAAVLAGDNPGYRSVMSPQPRQLFNPYNASALADLLTQSIRHDKVRARARAWGLEYTAKFDVGVVGKQLEDIYAKALRKHQRQ
jgi:phosphatidylinositol alpha-mannosyltransferase